MAELELELIWYKYLTSTGSRKPSTAADFAKIAKEKLPKQLYIKSNTPTVFWSKVSVMLCIR